MTFRSSPKVFEGFICDFPQRTIERIAKGFQNIGLEVVYEQSNIGNIHLGKASIEALGWSQYGKGATSILAKASAYAELAERFSTGCFECRIPPPMKPGSFQNLLQDVNRKTFLRGYRVNQDPNLFSREEIQRFFIEEISPRTYEHLHKTGLLVHVAEAYSATVGKTISSVPIDLIECLSNTNGLASGNTLEEAVSHAACEVFERYASIRIITNHIICPTINPATIHDEYIQTCLAFLNSKGIETIIKDFSMNGMVPVAGVLFIDHRLDNESNKLRKNRDYQRVNVGSHVNIKEAIRRCFHENFQVLDLHKEQLDILYSFWTKTMKKRYRRKPKDFRFYVKDFDIYHSLSFLKKGQTIPLQRISSVENSDCLHDIQYILGCCRKNHWDLWMIDYTHRLLQFPTVRVVIPPISTDFDPLGREVILKETFEERFNYFHGIQDLYYYVQNNTWIGKEIKTRKLINNIEQYLAENLDHYLLYIVHEQSYLSIHNLFNVLYFCYLSLGDQDTAMKYQHLLSTLEEKPLDRLNMAVLDSKLSPFYLSKGTMEQQIKNMALLHTINDSFTGKLKTGR
jgi:ribosomal protein S12 methylthiotransferase accessory factor